MRRMARRYVPDHLSPRREELLAATGETRIAVAEDVRRGHGTPGGSRQRFRDRDPAARPQLRDCASGDVFRHVVIKEFPCALEEYDVILDVEERRGLTTDEAQQAFPGVQHEGTYVDDPLNIGQ